MLTKITLAAAVVIAGATAAFSPHHAGNPGGQNRLDLQGGAARAAWLRRQGDQDIRVQIPEGVIAVKPMPKAGLEARDREGQIRKEL